MLRKVSDDATKEGYILIKYIVQGGTRLSGSVTISGAKNAAVAILPATLLVRPVPDRKRSGYLRCASAAGDPARYGRGDPPLRPQHAGDRLLPRPQRHRTHRARAPHPRVVLPGSARSLAASATPTSPCPAAATSASAPSTSISRALRPWAPWSSSPAAMSAPTPEGRSARRPYLS